MKRTFNYLFIYNLFVDLWPIGFIGEDSSGGRGGEKQGDFQQIVKARTHSGYVYMQTQNLIVI